jgi:competence/damage-inducible protein CinA-like protein
MKNVKASIVTIGDELLIGQVIDTNSSWIAGQLTDAGVEVIRKMTVGDNKEAIQKMLDIESLYSDIILITGGLGPTSDDITKKTLCDYFGGRLVVNDDALANVKYLFESIFKKPASDINLQQALVPDICEVLPNKRGTAPGMVFYKDGKMYISMPGVPYEMEGMLSDGVLPLIKSKWQLPTIVHLTLVTAGIGESALAEKIKDFEESLPSDIKLAYLPSYGVVRLRLTSMGDVRVEVEQKVDNYFWGLKVRVKEFLVTEHDDKLEVVLGKLLREREKTIATAESCTGGYVAHLITSVPGASDYYEGSVISYSSEIKETLLGVKESTLEKHGAVSEQTVIEMLHGLITRLHTNYGIAVSGIMGPGGGTDEKPVGTVWMAVGDGTEFMTQKLQLRFNRKRNIEITATIAINFMRKFLVTH